MRLATNKICGNWLAYPFAHVDGVGRVADPDEREGDVGSGRDSQKRMSLSGLLESLYSIPSVVNNYGAGWPAGTTTMPPFSLLSPGCILRAMPSMSKL